MIIANAFSRGTEYEYDQAKRLLTILGLTVEARNDDWLLNKTTPSSPTDGVTEILQALEFDTRAGKLDQVTKIFVNPHIAASLVIRGIIPFERAYTARLSTELHQISFGVIQFGNVLAEIVAVAQDTLDVKFDAIDCRVITTNDEEIVIV